MKFWALAVLPVLIWPSVAAAKFAPSEGKTYRYTVVEEREAGRFTSERRIVFRRVEKGWTAELIVVAADATGPTDAATMSRHVLSALVGRRIRYSLNDQGVVVAVEDQDALIELIAGAVGAVPGKESSAARDAAAGRMAKTLAALGPDMRRTLLASLLSPVVGGALSDAPAGERSIAMPAGSAMAQATAELTGTEKVVRNGDRITIDTAAEGPASSAGATIRIVQHREIDAASGIVLANDRRTETWLTAAPDRKQVATTSARVQN